MLVLAATVAFPFKKETTKVIPVIPGLLLLVKPELNSLLSVYLGSDRALVGLLFTSQSLARVAVSLLVFLPCLSAELLSLSHLQVLVTVYILLAGGGSSHEDC